MACKRSVLTINCCDRPIVEAHDGAEMAEKEAKGLQGRVLMRMKELGDMKQNELEFLSGCSQQTISLIMNGKVEETAKIVQISRALKCGADWLFDGHGSKERRAVEGLDEETALEAFVTVQGFLEDVTEKRSREQKCAMFLRYYDAVNQMNKSGHDRSKEDEKQALLALIRAFNGEPQNE